MLGQISDQSGHTEDVFDLTYSKCFGFRCMTVTEIMQAEYLASHLSKFSETYWDPGLSMQYAKYSQPFIHANGRWDWKRKFEIGCFRRSRRGYGSNDHELMFQKRTIRISLAAKEAIEMIQALRK